MKYLVGVAAPRSRIVTIVIASVIAISFLLLRLFDYCFYEVIINIITSIINVRVVSSRRRSSSSTQPIVVVIIIVVIITRTVSAVV